MMAFGIAGQPPPTICWHVGKDGTLGPVQSTAGAPERYRLLRLLARIHRDDRHFLFEISSETTMASSFVVDLRCPRPRTCRVQGERWVRLTASRDADGDGHRFTALAIDITDLKNSQRELQDQQNALNGSLIELQKTKGKMEAQSEILMNTARELETARVTAEEASRVKSEFLSNMSHELRTPLNAIIGFSQIIKEQTFGPVGSTKYRDYAVDIHESGIHLLELINEVLDYSRVEAGAAELLEDDVDVAAVFGTVIRMVRDRAAKQGVLLTIDSPDDLPRLRADTKKIRQILLNLLTNAIKFTKNGGTVTVTAWARASGGYVLQVSDTGIGIALADIPKALGVFGQIDSVMTRQHDGTGLGLPLTKSLAEMHGGSLDLQSQPGVGTTVTVRFPAERIIKNLEDVPDESDERVVGVE
jgi:signal transduction histidine kinase